MKKLIVLMITIVMTTSMVFANDRLIVVTDSFTGESKVSTKNIRIASNNESTVYARFQILSTKELVFVILLNYHGIGVSLQASHPAIIKFKDKTTQEMTFYNTYAFEGESAIATIVINSYETEFKKMDMLRFPVMYWSAISKLTYTISEESANQISEDYLLIKEYIDNN